MALEAELVDDAADLQPLVDEWQALAIANAQPMALPAWLLAWLRHLAPADVCLRSVVVRDRGRLVGLAPMVTRATTTGRVDYRLMGAPLPRLSPLAVPGREWEIAQIIADTLAQATPRVDALALECLSLASHWPQALRDGWPTRLAPRASQYLIQSSPTVALDAPSFEAWLAGKSKSYRAEMRRGRRRLADAGGALRLATPSTVQDDIDSFLRLHRGRWEGRGRSSIAEREGAMRKLLLDSAAEMLADGHLRLFVIEVEGRAIAAQINVAAGGEVLCLNGGWDERFARLSPQILCLLAGLEDAFGRGDRRLDLGPGTQTFKLRMADGDDPVAWTILMPPGPRLPLTLARTAPMLARRRAIGLAKRALPAAQLDRLRGVRRGLRGLRPGGG